VDGVIPGLRGSVLHIQCTEVYRRHQANGAGWCLTCGQPMPCLPRRHAAAVLLAAGDDIPEAEDILPLKVNAKQPDAAFVHHGVQYQRVNYPPRPEWITPGDPRNMRREDLPYIPGEVTSGWENPARRSYASQALEERTDRLDIMR
jgi:hypothetical protein